MTEQEWGREMALIDLAGSQAKSDVASGLRPSRSGPHSVPVRGGGRRAVYLGLTQMIESQIRDAYLEKYYRGEETLESVAMKLGIGKQALKRRLNGIVDLKLTDVADLVWALGLRVNLTIADRKNEDRSESDEGAEPPHDRP